MAARDERFRQRSNLPWTAGETVEQQHRRARGALRWLEPEWSRQRGVHAMHDGTMADGPGKAPEIQLQIQLDDDVANGHYVNMALVNHTETEFTLDFIYVQPQQPRAKVRSRIITNPKHMKRLFMAMQDNLAKFEARFGPIEVTDPDNPVH
jgi:hypothetical protein